MEFENVQEQFKGRVLHSHTYREPDSFRNSRVVILGAGPSGQDIALEIAHIAQMVRNFFSFLLLILYYSQSFYLDSVTKCSFVIIM